ncbi:MAG: quinolinate synthase NadA [Bacteroidaceae bacterium]|nr:quinolinate synthase NadA [Bacteroidaceae bacterium]MBQ3540021.1 quinolinate synthase NadA [Bacteroidaceae bacterium]MBQ6693272.1 quinolinate synthase NadA [Bacteroidaceae bacterium]MBR7166371.1 quinolinate synthase NadA [Bacteroidaceae bacterium]
MIKKEWREKGFVDEPIPQEIDLKLEIRRLCKEKNAVIMGHYYTRAEIQDVADFVGDSLALAQQAAKTRADIIVMCGVHFMAETNKILCPDKLVLLPDLNAGCSLADSCPAEELAKYKKEHPDYKVVAYVNTSAAVKALTDVVVTSSNARAVVDSFPKDEKIIFAPDKNLGNYLNAVTGRSMMLWNGGCHVHEEFSVEKIVELKRENPDAKVLAHPECKSGVLALADFVGSTAAILEFAQNDDCNLFIVATESGILHEMQKRCPNKRFIPVPPLSGGCACNECAYMRLNTLEKLYNCLKYEWPFVELDERMRECAKRPIERMLEISERMK